MAGVLGKIGTVLRETGSAFRGMMPALRSARGTYGTQRAESAELDRERRARYPRD